MAEKAEKKPDTAAEKKDAGKGAPGAAAAAPAAAAGGGAMGFLTKTPVLIGGAMLVEAVVLIIGFKVIGGSPKAAAGADVATQVSKDEKDAKGDKVEDKNREVEIDLVDFLAPNKLTGRSFLYEVKIVVSTKAEFHDKVKQAITDHGALITDRVRTIIAESDPVKLDGSLEPGLETLRRQVKFQLEEIVGEGMVDNVLVPKCIPHRTDN